MKYKIGAKIECNVYDNGNKNLKHVIKAIIKSYDDNSKLYFVEFIHKDVILRNCSNLITEDQIIYEDKPWNRWMD